MKAFSPVMRGLANTMNRADGGAAMARLALLESAATSSDRWLTSALLLEELEKEARRIGDEKRASPSEDRDNRAFQSAEELVENVQREGVDAGVLGVLGAVVVFAAQQFLSGNMEVSRRSGGRASLPGGRRPERARWTCSSSRGYKSESALSCSPFEIRRRTPSGSSSEARSLSSSASDSERRSLRSNFASISGKR